MNNKLLVATHNKGKVAEIKLSLGDSLEILSLDNLQITAEAIEDGNDFYENSAIKAKYYYDLSNVACISDDSGLCIKALGGFPGLRTKEFMEECGSYMAAFAKLEQMLSAHPKPWQAEFICVISYYDGNKLEHFTGKTEGYLQFPAEGEFGFGYDPIFVPNGYDKPFAVLGDTVKKQHSHRAKAIKLFKEYFEAL